jgi:hypothetical protein
MGSPWEDKDFLNREWARIYAKNGSGYWRWVIRYCGRGIRALKERGRLTHASRINREPRKPREKRKSYLRWFIG